MRKVYIAGPMSGLPDLNYPAFNQAAKDWEAKGYEALNPADNGEGEPKTYGEYLRLGLDMLLQADEIVLLPGWEKSKGARLERHAAELIGMTIHEPCKPSIRGDWDTFLAEATDVFVAKNTDYDSRFTRALIQYHSQRGAEAARTIWAWEVEKKLDRCRTWIKRGELLVKDEGVRNSVIDAFNYTVQWSLFNNSLFQNADPVRSLTEASFYAAAAKFTAADWVNYWAREKLLDPGDVTDSQVMRLLHEEMTGKRGANG